MIKLYLAILLTLFSITARADHDDVGYYKYVISFKTEDLSKAVGFIFMKPAQARDSDELFEVLDLSAVLNQAGEFRKEVIFVNEFESIYVIESLATKEKIQKWIDANSTGSAEQLGKKIPTLNEEAFAKFAKDFSNENDLLVVHYTFPPGLKNIFKNCAAGEHFAKIVTDPIIQILEKDNLVMSDAHSGKLMPESFVVDYNNELGSKTETPQQIYNQDEQDFRKILNPTGLSPLPQWQNKLAGDQPPVAPPASPQFAEQTFDPKWIWFVGAPLIALVGLAGLYFYRRKNR